MSGIETLIGRVAAIAGTTREVARAQVDAVFAAIVAEIAAGEDVRIPELGSFLAVERPAGSGRDPRTGEPIVWDARKTVRFRPAKALREQLNPERQVPRTFAPTKRAGGRG